MLSSTSDLDAWLGQIKQCKPLTESQMKLLCSIVKGQLLEESNIQPVSSPVTVVGDIHGQFWDVLELFRIAGECPDAAYVFMVRGCALCRGRGARAQCVHACMHACTQSTEAPRRLRVAATESAADAR